MREKQAVVHFSMSLPQDIHAELKSIAAEYQIPMTRVINSILRGYIRSRKERKK